MTVSPTENEVLDDKSESSLPTDQNTTEVSSTSENEDLDNTEKSSTSETSESDDISTYDLVKKAIGESEDEDAEGSSEKDESKGEGESSDKSEGKDSNEEDSDEPTEDELKAWKPKTRKRFEQLQTKYREANERLNEVTQKFQEAEVDAGYYRQFTGFLERNNLTQEDANKLFDLGALVRNDPVKAVQALTPIYNHLLEITGNVLSPELQQQVKQGYITEQHAYELSRQKAQNQQYQARQRDDQVRQQNTQNQNHQNLVKDIQTAIASKESDWQRNDPDYSIKQNRVNDRVKLMWFEAKQNGRMPQSKEDAVRMLDDIKRQVDDEFKHLRPKKQVNTPVDSSSHITTKPVPQSTMDVIRQTLGE